MEAESFLLSVLAAKTPESAEFIARAGQNTDPPSKLSVFPSVGVYTGCYSHPELFDMTFAFFGCVLGCFSFSHFLIFFFFYFS